MDKRTRKMVEDWISRQAYLDDEEKGELCKLIVHRASSGGGIGIEIDSIPIKGKPSAEETIALGERVSEITQNDADTTSTMQRYLLVAMHKDGKTLSRGSKLAFKVSSSNDDEEGEMSEAPTTKGIITQMMRHTESFAKISSLTAERAIQSLSGQLESANQRIDAMMEKNFELTGLIEDLVSKKHERELRTLEISMKMDLYKEGANKLMILAPILVNKLFSKKGEKILKENSTAIEQMVHSFMQTLKPAQFNGLLEGLDNDQKMAMMELYESMRKFDPPEPKQIEATSGNGTSKPST